MSDGFPKLIHVETSDRDGKKAYFDDGMVAEYDHVADCWRPATAHISYRDLFTETTKTYTRATDALNLELAPEVAVED
jgi:phage baseplate assembly protein gpV